MKLYIATSSLNLINILSTESISPIAFYSEREFGAKRYYPIQELKAYNNSLLLFEKYPQFNQTQNAQTKTGEEIEGYLLIIEIETNFTNLELKKVAEGIYQVSETVYLNPISTKFCFQTQANSTAAFNSLSAAAEVKVQRIYESSFMVITSPTKTYDLSKVSDTDSSSSKLHEDMLINRLKGFAYSYIIGANSAQSELTAWGLATIKNIEDLSCAIVNSPSRQGTKEQRDKMIESYRDLAILFINKRLPEISIPDLLEIRRAAGGFKHVRFEEKESSLFMEGDNLKTIEKLRSWVLEYEKAKKFDFTNIAIRIKGITQFDDNIFLKESIDTLLYTRIINEILIESGLYRNDLLPEKVELTKKITFAAKDIFEERHENWDNSEERRYLNNLIKNLKGNEEYLHPPGYGIIANLGAFMQSAGEVDKLSNILIREKISDPRMAWGLYGCISGYSSLSRSFTDRFYVLDDVEYISRIYKKIFYQLHSVELEGEITIVKPSAEEIKKENLQEKFQCKDLKIQNNTIEKLKLEEFQKIIVSVLDVPKDLEKKIEELPKDARKKINALKKVFTENNYQFDKKLIELVKNLDGFKRGQKAKDLLAKIEEKINSMKIRQLNHSQNSSVEQSKNEKYAVNQTSTDNLDSSRQHKDKRVYRIIEDTELITSLIKETVVDKEKIFHYYCGESHSRIDCILRDFQYVCEQTKSKNLKSAQEENTEILDFFKKLKAKDNKAPYLDDDIRSEIIDKLKRVCL